MLENKCGGRLVNPQWLVVVINNKEAKLFRRLIDFKTVEHRDRTCSGLRKRITEYANGF